MADKEYAHLILILDRSGSMGGPKLEGGIEGVNHLLMEQEKAELGFCTVTMVQFDTEYEELYSFKPIHMVEKRSKENWLPRGATSLYDAVGRAIATDLEKIAALEEDKKPGVIIVNVTTDGFENASSEYTQERVKELIQEREAANWVISYISAGVDGVNQAADMGVDLRNFSNTEAGSVGSAYGSVSSQVLRSREVTSRGGVNALMSAKVAGEVGFTGDELSAMNVVPPQK